MELIENIHFIARREFNRTNTPFTNENYLKFFKKMLDELTVGVIDKNTSEYIDQLTAEIKRREGLEE